MEDGLRRSKRLGTVDKLTTKASARKEADKLLGGINERKAGLTMAGLCDCFNLECKNGDYLRPHSIQTYKSFAKRIRIELGGRAAQIAITLRAKPHSLDSRHSLFDEATQARALRDSMLIGFLDVTEAPQTFGVGQLRKEVCNARVGTHAKGAIDFARCLRKSTGRFHPCTA